MKKNILIYGFGRMGITHYAILNQLIPNGNFVFIDPDIKMNYIAKNNLNVEIFKDDKNLTNLFDYVLICTPPIFHVPILNECINKNITNIFVEKPFGGINDDFSALDINKKQVSIGYVLRFNPIVQWIKNYISVAEIVKVEGFYFSNTIEKKPNGWRNQNYSGVTNEIGSHLIDLCIYLFGLDNPQLIDKSIVSVVSDVDDIVIANFKENSISYHFHFNWVNKEFRKPVFKFQITMIDGLVIKFDQQKVEFLKDNKLFVKKSISDISDNVPFYLRGVDFTNQMHDFIGSKTTIASFQDAFKTRLIINKLISK